MTLHEPVYYQVKRDVKTKRFHLYVTVWTGSKHIFLKRREKLFDKTPSVRDFYEEEEEEESPMLLLPYSACEFDTDKYASRIFKMPPEWMSLDIHNSLKDVMWSKNRKTTTTTTSFISSNEEFLNRYLSMDYRNRAKYEFKKICHEFDPSTHGFILVSQTEPFDEWRYELIRVLISGLDDPKYGHILVIKDDNGDLKKAICRRMFHGDDPRNLFRSRTESDEEKKKKSRVVIKKGRIISKRRQKNWYYFDKIRRTIFGPGVRTLLKRHLSFFRNNNKRAIVYLDREALRRVSVEEEDDGGISMWDFENFYPSIATRYNDRDPFLAKTFEKMINVRRSGILNDKRDIKEIMVKAVGHAANFDPVFHDFVRRESVAVMKRLVFSNVSRVLGVCTDGILLKGVEPPSNVPLDLRIKREFYAVKYAFHSINLYCCWDISEEEEERFVIKGLPHYNKNRPSFVENAVERLASVAIGASPENLEDICEWTIRSRKWRLTDLLLVKKPTKYTACDYYRNNLSPFDKPLVFTKDETAVSTLKDGGWPFADDHANLLDARLCKSYDIDRYVKLWYDMVTVLLKVLLDYPDPPTYHWWHDNLSPILSNLCGSVASQLPGITSGSFYV